MNELPPSRSSADGGALRERGGDKLARRGSPPSLLKEGVRGSSEQGSILMEALIAVAILSIAITVIVQGLTAAYRASRMGWRYSEAALALENAVVEKIYQGGVAAGADEEGKMEKPFTRYRYRLSSQPMALNGGPNERINDVTIDVQWNEGVKKHSVGLQTFLFNTSTQASDENFEF